MMVPEGVDEAEVLNMVQEARNKGHTDTLTMDTIVAYLYVDKTDMTWENAAEVIGCSVDKAMSKKRSLIRDGVIEQTLPYPSRMAQGEVADLLEYLERKNPDHIFDGTPPSTWANSIEQLIRWMKLETSKLEGRAAVVSSLNSVDVFYGDYVERGDGDLGRLLTQRRLSTEAIRLITYETTSRVERRLNALREHSKYDVNSMKVVGKPWFWCSQ